MTLRLPGLQLPTIIKGTTMRHTVIFASAFATLVTASAFAADLPG
ncbi:proline/glycine betaine ABC transporter substrate-binding protein ProX, partial [Salmonella enterica subsp. enterica serovar Braenderup]|nr:proline/glycine betaine ABC transporter substrate-binding protein ProX [Salmonella enterica subsp. enterica serovar Braenderup]